MATDESTTTSTEAAESAAGEAALREPVKRPAPAASEKKPRKRRRWLRVLVGVVVALAVVAAALAALFAWDRWYRYDDAADIQGTWYPAGSTAAVQISADAIAFDAETAYAYTLDAHEKSIMYTLGNLTGKGHYWFADDRTTLVIEDCADFTTRDTTLDDLGRMLANLGAAITGGEPELPQGEGYSVFTRTPDPAAVAAREEAARQALAAEEAARQADEAAARAEKEAAEAEAQAEAEATEAEPAEPAADGEAAGAEPGAEADPTGDPAEPADEAAEEQQKDFSNESMGIFE